MYYTSTQEGCPSIVVSVVSPKLTENKVWLIKSEAALGKDCDYIVQLTSHNDTDLNAFPGALSLS